jgi:hypothetical protein
MPMKSAQMSREAIDAKMSGVQSITKNRKDPREYRFLNSDQSKTRNICSNCKSMSCRGKLCHKKILHVFKAFAANDSNKDVYHFTTKDFRSDHDLDFFRIYETKRDNKIMLVKPLQSDMTINLKMRNGRFETTVKIFVYVSEFDF